MSNKSQGRLKVLQALHGDAICIRFAGTDENHNIFIDGGFARTYQNTVRVEAEEVARVHEKIDLFIITHVDHDHVGGVIRFAREFGQSNLVKQYWLNRGPDANNASTFTTNMISIADGYTLTSYLAKTGGLQDFDITTEMNALSIYGAKITILSPSKDALQNFKALWNQARPTNGASSRVGMGVPDYAKAVDVLARNAFVEDDRAENRAAIAFLFQAQGRSILFLGDSWPSTIINALKGKGFSTNNKLRVDFVMLAHHASKFNTNNELLSLIDCSQYIVSANGKNRYYFPHKEALARVLAHPDRDLSRTVSLHFNYDNEVLRTIFTPEETDRYNIACFYPDKSANGCTIIF